MQAHGTILKAAYFEAEKHKSQRRKNEDASPYINHPLEVAMLLAEIGGIEDPEILAAALLHDTVEDTATTPEEIEKNFSSRIRTLVEEVTDDKKLPKLERKQQQIDHAKHISPDAALIKLGDKISNITDVTDNPPAGWDLQRRRDYLIWAEKVIRNLPRVNILLEKRFEKVLAQGMRRLDVS